MEHVLDQRQGVGIVLRLLVEAAVIHHSPPLSGDFLGDYEAQSCSLACCFLQPSSLHKPFELRLHSRQPVAFEGEHPVPEDLRFGLQVDVRFSMVAPDRWRGGGLPTEERLLLALFDPNAEGEELGVVVRCSLCSCGYLNHRAYIHLCSWPGLVRRSQGLVAIRGCAGSIVAELKLTSRHELWGAGGRCKLSRLLNTSPQRVGFCPIFSSWSARWSNTLRTTVLPLKQPEVMDTLSHHCSCGFIFSTLLCRGCDGYRVIALSCSSERASSPSTTTSSKVLGELNIWQSGSA